MCVHDNGTFCLSRSVCMYIVTRHPMLNRKETRFFFSIKHFICFANLFVMSWNIESPLNKNSIKKSLSACIVVGKAIYYNLLQSTFEFFSKETNSARRQINELQWRKHLSFALIVSGSNWSCNLDDSPDCIISHFIYMRY